MPPQAAEGVTLEQCDPGLTAAADLDQGSDDSRSSVEVISQRDVDLAQAEAEPEEVTEKVSSVRSTFYTVCLLPSRRNIPPKMTMLKFCLLSVNKTKG